MKKTTMKKVIFAIAGGSLALSLGGCALVKSVGGGPTDTVTSIANVQYPSVDSSTVKIYLPGMNVPSDHKVIGQVSVSLYTWGGVTRTQDEVYHIMRAKAGSIGGQGLIDIKDGLQNATASVIRFK